MANLEAVLAGLEEEVAQGASDAFHKTLDTLDVRLADAVRADAAGILGGLLSALGRTAPHGTPDGFRKATACTVLGHVEYRKLGLYIGSGLVEAACRTDVARRCKQSGMHWRFHNAAAMCALVARFRSNLAAA